MSKTKKQKQPQMTKEQDMTLFILNEHVKYSKGIYDLTYEMFKKNPGGPK